MIYLFLFISLMALNGCEQKSPERQYTEVVIEAPKAGMLATTDPHTGMDISAAGAMMPTANTSDLTWTLPQGWMGGAAQGMRLAAFYLKNDPKNIDVSIVALEGMAGGLEANLSRWLGQIQLPAAENDVKKLIAEAQDVRTRDQLEAKIYDLTVLTKDTNAASMIVAVISTDSRTVFVKMTGSKNNCLRQKDNFLKFVRSLSQAGGEAGNTVEPTPVAPVTAREQNSPLHWQAPSSWKQIPGSGFRLVTFHLDGDDQAMDGSIVALQGAAGGVEANLSRWLGQIQLSVSEDALAKLIAQAKTVRTAGQIEAKIYDFTALTDGEETRSMIAAMMSVNGRTVFVKMTGSKNNCLRQKDNFLELVRSISAP